MLAVVVISSILTGALGFGTALMIDAPFWVALLAYPICGAFGLLAAALMIRTVEEPGTPRELGLAPTALHQSQ